MRFLKMTGLSIAAVATLSVGIAPAFADHHHRPHQICKVERHHGHAKRVCHWGR